MTHAWVEVGFRGCNLELRIEAEYDPVYDEILNLRVRNEAGDPISQRLEDALFAKYSQDFCIAIHQSAKCV